MADKEHPPATLREPKVHGVEHAPRATIARVPEFLDEDVKVLAAVCPERTFDVFPDDPARLGKACNFREAEREPAALVGHAFAVTLDAETLAWRPPDENVDFAFCEFCFFMNFVRVSKIFNVGVMMG
jgi:hypothetical protein